MQYNPSNLQARDGFGEFAASSMFAPSTKLINYVDFATNEPISVLDTRSPSPSTSTSSFAASATAFNPPGNIFLNETPLHHHSLGNGFSQNFSVGFEQDEILKQNEGFACLGGGSTAAAAAAPPILDNVSSTLSALGVSCYGDFENLRGLNPLLHCNPNQDQIFNVGGVASNLGFPKQLHFPQIVDVANLPSTNVVPLPLPRHEAPIDQHYVYNEVCKAVETIEDGNFSNAQGILARLNHIVAPVGKPFLRSAFHVKEALEVALNRVATAQNRVPSPADAMFKICAYDVYSQVSPVIHFMNITANQLILEAVGDCERIHIIDFDVGFGAHWSSLLQELPFTSSGVKSVKITAFASPSTRHWLEINLIHENLTDFASSLGINFELDVVNVDSFDPNCSSASSLRSSESEVIAVNFPIWSLVSYLCELPSYLCLMKRLSPKIIVSMSRGCERIDLPFPLHVLHTLHYYEALLNSVDAANLTCDTSNNIVRFLFQPRIESTLLGRLLSPNSMPSWRKLFASMGYSPVNIGDFAETQAQCLLKKMQVQGFRIERQEASLVLCWNCCEVVLVSAWKC